MKKLIAIAIALFGLLRLPAYAHRLDEYLEATILSIGSDRVDGSMRLVPGVAVSPVVIASIDTNGDGVFSESEQQAYVQRVLNDLVLKVDNHPLTIRFVSASFPSTDQIKQGTGEIQLNFTAELRNGSANRSLIFQNHHQQAIAVYLVNCLVPQDKNIHLAEQIRNENQSFYQLNFVQESGAIRKVSLSSFSGFAGAFRLGVRHIAEGTDHLLFLLTLLLPAPLFASAGRWSRTATVGQSMTQIIRIVTAFTLGHSLTLLLSAFGVLHLPSRPVEILIAVSILISAIHAMRPIFPGREAVITAFFGLIHGLAFASALSDLGFGQWYRFVSVLAFNLGIEAMQLAVIVAALPSIILLSRTVTYKFVRVGGALFATVVSVGWIIERTFNVPNVISSPVEMAAHHAPWIAVSFFLSSLLCWSLRNNGHGINTARRAESSET
jgi:hypothetical protein